MCEVLVLMLNAFYRFYYQLFDLCEHALISALILIVVFICFVPVVLTSKSEEQRPLFTIGVLVCGVVGGLTVVISVVYLYRFCLKKRPNVTTTVKPDFKREHIRSVATGLSRPLPLPPEILANSKSSTKIDVDGDEHESRSIVPLIVHNDSNYALRLNTSTYNTLLSVSPGPTRAHSAELAPPDVSEEVRRASFEVMRGTGRQLPSTEGLQKQLFTDQRQRRMSNFARSNALPYAPGPRKQVSSPLPDQTQQRRIYDRGHAHSRSWNPEGLPSPPPNPVGRNYRFFQETKQPRVEEFAVPIINEPPPIPVDDGRRRSVVRQAKSFDDRNSNERRQVMNINGRSYTLSEKRRRGPENVSAACQTLWAAKGHLEQLQALGISEPSSVSTSFESNTDSQATADTVDLKPPHTAAKGKRLQYGSLLLQRQFLSTAAVSSMDSNNSTDESSDPAVFASSFESTRSELEQRRLSLMNRNHDQNDSDEAAPGPSSRSIPMQQETQRDYCVDARSDSLFREWSRVDPAYEPVDVRVRLQRGHTVDHSPSHVQVQNARRFSRQFSLASPGPSPLLMPTMERQSMYSDV